MLKSKYNHYVVVWPSGEMETIQIPTWVTAPCELKRKLSHVEFFLKYPHRQQWMYVSHDNTFLIKNKPKTEKEANAIIHELRASGKLK